MDAGLAGGIAGAVIGVTGAAVGTYFGIANSRGPAERALMLRLAFLGWLWLAALAAWLLLPHSFAPAAVLLTLPPLVSIPWLNRVLARARSDDQGRSGQAG